MVLEQNHHSLFSQVLLLEVYLSHQVKSVKPYPLRPVVIAETVGNFSIRGIVTVVIERRVVVMSVSQCAHSDRFAPDQMLFHFVDIGPCVSRLT